MLNTDFISFSTRVEMEWTPLLVLRLLIMVSISFSIIGFMKNELEDLSLRKNEALIFTGLILLTTFRGISVK